MGNQIYFKIQSQPNFAEMILEWFSSKIVSGISENDQDGHHSRT
jgi:hypothetical protein